MGGLGGHLSLSLSCCPCICGGLFLWGCGRVCLGVGSGGKLSSGGEGAEGGDVGGPGDGNGVMDDPALEGVEYIALYKLCGEGVVARLLVLSLDPAALLVFLLYPSLLSPLSAPRLSLLGDVGFDPWSAADVGLRLAVVGGVALLQVGKNLI